MLSSVFTNAFIFRRLAAGVAFASMLAAPALASAQTENFETKNYDAGVCKGGGGSEIGYIGDKEYAGFLALDLVNYRTTCGYGYKNGYGLLGASAGNVVALGSTPSYVHSSNPFVLNSMVAGAGWQNPTSLFMQFYLNEVLLSSQTIQLSTYETGLSLYTGFYAGATDFIRFTPIYPAAGDYSGDVFGSHKFYCPEGSAADCSGRYESWFVDNLDFSPATVVVTPEPMTVGMLGFGLVGLGLVRRKRRQA